MTDAGPPKTVDDLSAKLAAILHTFDARLAMVETAQKRMEETLIRIERRQGTVPHHWD